MLRGMGAALRAEPDRVDELAATGVPILVLYGAADDAWSPDVQATMASRLHARVAVIPDAMHSPAIDNPAATIAALLQFWA
jgi:pimeloyl-ACP methyl ester carboxylesterase